MADKTDIQNVQCRGYSRTTTVDCLRIIVVCCDPISDFRFSWQTDGHAFVSRIHWCEKKSIKPVTNQEIP